MSASQKPAVLRPTHMRGMNSALVLRLLRRSDRLSRAEIARHTGLSEGTVSRITAELIDRSLVVEDGAENSTGGRPAMRLQLSHQPLALGVDIQNWETRFAVGTMRGQIIESSRVRTPPDPAKMLRLIAERFREYRKAYGRERLDRIGVCARGIVDSQAGVVEVGNDPRWVGIRVKDQLQSALGVPAFVENNVRAASLAEFHHTNPAFHNSRCLLYVLVGEGVGVGLIIEGKLYSGPHMAAGEFGQMVIADNGSSERHDRPGCLEALVSNTAVCERYAGLTHGRSMSQSGDSASRVRRICHRALAGEENALKVLRQTARYLGIGIANIVWGLDADTVVVNSDLSEGWSVLSSTILEQFPNSDEWPTFRSIAVRQSLLGDQGPLVGAMTLPFANVFQDGELSRLAAARSA